MHAWGKQTQEPGVERDYRASGCVLSRTVCCSFFVLLSQFVTPGPDRLLLKQFFLADRDYTGRRAPVNRYLAPFLRHKNSTALDDSCERQVGIDNPAV